LPSKSGNDSRGLHASISDETLVSGWVASRPRPPTDRPLFENPQQVPFILQWSLLRASVLEPLQRKPERVSNGSAQVRAPRDLTRRGRLRQPPSSFPFTVFSSECGRATFQSNHSRFCLSNKKLGMPFSRLRCCDIHLTERPTYVMAIQADTAPAKTE
jgi:hypothetical protein